MAQLMISLPLLVRLEPASLRTRRDIQYLTTADGLRMELRITGDKTFSDLGYQR